MLKRVCTALSAAMLFCASGQNAADAGTAKEKVVYSFRGGSDAHKPFADMIAVKGKLYGTTETGGAYGYGALFAFEPGTDGETVLHSFAGGADGQTPLAGLVSVNGMLYGTTTSGGALGVGTIFAFDPGTGSETIVYSFCSQEYCSDGREPVGGLIDVKGKLYGTTYLSNAYGTVFSFDPGTGSETVLHSFLGGVDGEWPRGNLTNAGGMLYGITQGGGNGSGVVYAVDPETGTETVLYSFCGEQNCSDGASPMPV